MHIAIHNLSVFIIQGRLKHVCRDAHLACRSSDACVWIWHLDACFVLLSGRISNESRFSASKAGSRKFLEYKVSGIQSSVNKYDGHGREYSFVSMFRTQASMPGEKFAAAGFALKSQQPYANTCANYLY